MSDRDPVADLQGYLAELETKLTYAPRATRRHSLSTRSDGGCARR